ncbi:MAG: hypothetical protein AAF697_14270 [Pseudomonadota bacterium]
MIFKAAISLLSPSPLSAAKLDASCHIVHVTKHIEPVVNKDRDAEAFADWGFLWPLSAKVDVLPFQACSIEEVVMFKPMKRLALYVGATFGDDMHIVAKTLFAKAADRFDSAFEHGRCKVVVSEKGCISLCFGGSYDDAANVYSNCVFHFNFSVFSDVNVTAGDAR